MEIVYNILSGIGWILLLAGSAFSVIGGLGIVRMPDFYSRLHGGGITDTLGAGLIMSGLMLMTLSISLLAVAKLFMILAFLLITSPTACHALAQSALSSGLQPLTGKPDTWAAKLEKSRRTDADANRVDPSEEAR